MTPKETYQQQRHETRKQSRDAAILREYDRRELLDMVQFSIDTTELFTLSDGSPESVADMVRDTLGYSL